MPDRWHYGYDPRGALPGVDRRLPQDLHNMTAVLRPFVEEAHA